MHGGLAEYEAKMFVEASGGGQKSRHAPGGAQSAWRRPRRGQEHQKGRQGGAKRRPERPWSRRENPRRSPGGPQEHPRRTPRGPLGVPRAAQSVQASIFDPSDARALVKNRGFLTLPELKVNSGRPLGLVKAIELLTESCSRSNSLRFFAPNLGQAD